MATVEDGKVTATGAGSTTILVRAGGKIDTLSICIYNATVAANTTIPIYKYELGANSEYRYVSSTRTLTASASEEAKLIVAPAIFDSNYMQLNTGINYKYTNGYGDIYLRKDDIHLITDS